MKKVLAMGSLLVFFAGPVHAQPPSGICDPGRAAIGAVIGVVVGTLIFPGIGTALGASLGGGSLCAYDFAWKTRVPPAAGQIGSESPEPAIGEKTVAGDRPR